MFPLRLFVKLQFQTRVGGVVSLHICKISMYKQNRSFCRPKEQRVLGTCLLILDKLCNSMLLFEVFTSFSLDQLPIHRKLKCISLVCRSQISFRVRIKYVLFPHRCQVHVSEVVRIYFFISVAEQAESIDNPLHEAAKRGMFGVLVV